MQITLIAGTRPNFVKISPIIHAILKKRAAGLYRTDLMTNTEGFTLASLLLFGKEEAILSMLPHFKIDAIVRRIDTNRYDDRETFRSNLISAYDLLMHFVAKHLPDRFYQEGDHRISLREHIFREVIANFLIHREYISPRVSTLEILYDGCTLKNANKPHLYGFIEPNNYESFPKNPHIAKFFVQMARAEELGTGIRNVYRYSKMYSGKLPKFKEEDLFEVIIPLVKEKTTPKTTTKTTPKTTTKKAAQILQLMRRDSTIKVKEIARILRISVEGVRYHLKKMKKDKLIQFIGAAKTGHWVVFGEESTLKSDK